MSTAFKDSALRIQLVASYAWFESATPVKAVPCLAHAVLATTREVQKCPRRALAKSNYLNGPESYAPTFLIRALLDG